MRDADEIMRERQKHVRRQIDDRGLSLKAIAYDAGQMSYTTLLSYFPGNQDAQPAVMPLSALFAILNGNALPRDLVSMLLPDGDMIVKVPEGIDHEELCDAAQEYLSEKAKAHRHDSEMGPAIGPNEHERLCGKAAVLRAVAA